ncbi:MAG: putative O-glycosylation ligase, exosortase A system-associated [Burkholderiaceae bacterium]|nr:putative O-glycosylation ligase, exosortase A system-associated [Burkholderiaceae bacterium]
MRDIVLSIILFACIPVALARPFVGAVVFAWLSLMNPHRLTWDFAYDIPWAQMVAIATLIGLVFATDRQVFDSLRRMRLLIAYLAWTAITTMFALSETAALPKLIEFAKIQLMCLVTLALLSNWRRIEILTIAATLSVAFFGIKGGVFTVLTGGAFRVWGPPGSVIADNNQLAAALVMTMPLLFWLRQRTRNLWYRWAFLGCIALSGISILGSHSRGAFVAVLAMALFLVLRSSRRFEALIAVFVGAALAIVLMPAEYWARIASIGAYEQDASTIGRLEMWKTALNVANARITGGGFDMYVGGAVGEFAAGQVRSSHSIYFQALGEHGWPGLVLFLSFGLSVWFTAGRLIRRLPAGEENDSLVFLMRMSQVALVGFGVGGAFVNIGYWDYPYYLSVVVFACARLKERELVRLRGGPAGLPAGSGEPALPIDPTLARRQINEIR